MNFKKYEDIKKFWEDTQNLLEEKEWYNCLMIGNCIEGTEKGMDNWFLATIENDKQQIELILFYRKPWKLIMYSPTNNYSDEIIEYAATKVYEYDKKILGVNTQKDVAQKFAKKYCELSNMNYQVHTALRILLLEKIIEAPLLENVSVKTIEEKDKPILKQYIQEFMKEALREDVNNEETQNKIEKYLQRNYSYLEKDNKIVSIATVTRTMKYGKCISGVYTPPEERKKGYAYNLVYRMSKKCLDEGNKYCVLYTDDSNPISNHVYEKIGYKRMEDWEEIDFE